MLKNVIEILNQGWVGIAIGTLITVAGIAYTLRRSGIGARPAYQRRTLRLLGSDDPALPDGVEVRFNGRVVSSLTKTWIVFWNSGYRTLERQSIVAHDALRFELSSESQILDARIVKFTRSVNLFKIKRDDSYKNALFFDFDYMDRNDGVTIEILHTSSKETQVIKGSIRGVPDGIRDLGIIKQLPYFSPFPFSLNSFNRFSPSQKIRLFTKGMLMIISLFGIIVCIASIFASNLFLTTIGVSPQDTATFPAPPRIVMFFAGLMYIVMPVPYLWIFRRRFPKSLSISEFD